MPVIADASQLGSDAPMNPYFVSFLAIISGLMSENAIMMVQAQGAKFSLPRRQPTRSDGRASICATLRKANRNPSNVQQS